jgi:AbrB family looped-hinge helix DNA binding protein
MKSNKSTKHELSIYGIVTVNDKGQVVIPADARSIIDLRAGDKLIVMLHPTKEGVVLLKPDSLEAHAKQLLNKLSDAKEIN